MKEKQGIEVEKPGRARLDEDTFEKSDFESMIVVLRGCLGTRFQIQWMEVILTLVAHQNWPWFEWVKGSYLFLNRSWMTVRSEWQKVNWFPGRSGNIAFGCQKLGKKGIRWGKGKEKKKSILLDTNKKAQLSIFKYFYEGISLVKAKGGRGRGGWRWAKGKENRWTPALIF